MADGLIHIRFTGGDIAPELIRAKDLARVIIAVEVMLATVVATQDKSIQPEEVAVGLVDVEKGSLVLQFSAPRELLVERAYHHILDSVNSLNFGYLPLRAIEALQNLVDFTRRTHTRAEFRLRGAGTQALAVLTPETEITLPPLLRGPTTLYGKVLRVGGKKRPRVMLQTLQGETVYCQAPLMVAKELGRRLYAWVGLRGMAIWSPQTRILEAFEIEGITPYEDIPINIAFAELAKLIGEDYANLEDVTEYVRALRGYTAEDVDERRLLGHTGADLGGETGSIIHPAGDDSTHDGLPP